MLRWIIFIAALLACFTPWIDLPRALLLGTAVALMFGNPMPARSRTFSKMLLQLGIILLGFNMNLPAVLHAGASGLLIGLTTITLTLTAGYFLGRLLHLRTATATLLSAGTAICGGSAIAAVGSVIDAEPADLSVSLGTIFLLNAAGLYLFPLVGHAVGLSAEQFGTWAGIGIHDVSSVVGAATRFDLASLPTATAVKLSRALWIIPLTLGISLTRRRHVPELTNADFGFAPTPAKRRLQIPYFIAGFVLAATIRTLIPSLAPITPTIAHAATLGLTLALFLIGTGLTRSTLRSVGGRAFTHALLLWIFIGGGSLAMVLMNLH